MPPEMKARWKKEIDWLLSVTDQIVEFAPSKQSKNGVTFEVSSPHTQPGFLVAAEVNIPHLDR